MATEISLMHLSAIYLLFLIPLSITLWLKLPLVGVMVTSLLRMTVQLLFVGFYLEIIFQGHHPLLTLLWLLTMVIVADFSVLKGAELKVKPFFSTMAFSVLVGTAIPLFYMLHITLQRPEILEARFTIPIAGMIMGNCLRANVVGIGSFYRALRQQERVFQYQLVAGATLLEACMPHLRESFKQAMAPTLATMTTTGLVALPGMMTGVILGGSSPTAAIRYQIAIMIAIFTGTSITVLLGIVLGMKKSFSGYGVLKEEIFT